MQEYITNGRRVFRAILETWKFCPNTKIHLIIFFIKQMSPVETQI